MATSSLKFEEPKIFIKYANGDVAEWREMGVIKADTLSPAIADEFVDEWKKTLKETQTLSFSCTVRWTGGKWNKIRLLQQANILTRPKCTYRTVKRFSAKRNRH